MYDPDLYQQSNTLQKRDAFICLETHASKINWNKTKNRIIDLGCGDGSVTNTLKKYFPSDIKVLGCDISEKMVNFANLNHGNAQTSFSVLDISGDLPEGMKRKFDHVFSFYALHWIVDQKQAFTNIYNLLDKDGQCFVIFLACNPIFDIYRILSRRNKWKNWLRDVERFISPYHDSREPEKEIKNLMEKIGFVDTEVECKTMSFIYEDTETMTKAITAINPFNIPKEELDDFLDDYLDVLKQYCPVTFTKLRFQYKLIVAYGRRPSDKEVLEPEAELTFKSSISTKIDF